jgi:hypothetical protein
VASGFALTVTVRLWPRANVTGNATDPEKTLLE